jgi:hypothetical protein
VAAGEPAPNSPPRGRFGTNYAGLRNRFSVLSEAYSHLDFRARTAATRAFVLAVAEVAAEHRGAIAAICAAADAAATRGAGLTFGHGTALAPPTEEEVRGPAGIAA